MLTTQIGACRGAYAGTAPAIPFDGSKNVIYSASSVNLKRAGWSSARKD